MATFCFGLVVANQAMAKLSSPFMLQQAFFSFFYYNAEGDGNKAVVAFYFGLIATKKATTKLSLLSLLQQAFYFFLGYSAKGDNNNTSDVAVIAITFYFGLAMNMI
jgi:hypothetical protein